MKVAIGSDHAGFKMKKAIIKYLKRRKIGLKDFGAFSAESVDYPDAAKPVAKAVAGKKFQKGILICGTGIGMSMSANKVRGIRAALCHNSVTAKMAREHNDANILCLGSRILSGKTAVNILRVFLKARFAGGRHLRRVRKIMKISG